MSRNIEVRRSRRTNTLMVGTLLGASAGLVAAMLLNRRADREKRAAALTVSEGIKLGVLIFGLMRAIASLGDD